MKGRMMITRDQLNEMARAEKKNVGTGQFWRLYELAMSGSGKTIVEIGVSRYGSSTAPLLHVAQLRDGTLYSIDIKDFSNNWSKGEPNWEFIHGSSLEIVKTWDKPIDFLFIDSAHTYDVTRKEIHEWLPFVVTGSYVMFHDTHRYTKGVLSPILEFLLQYNNITGWEVHFIPETVGGTCYMRKVGKKPSYRCSECGALFELRSLSEILNSDYVQCCDMCETRIQFGREFGE